MRRAVRNPLVPVVVTALAATAILWIVVLDDESAETASPTTAVPTQGVHLMQAMERVSSESLSDWVNVADHVVDVTVTDEVRGEDPLVGDTSPNGEGLIRREVTLQVNEVLWSSPTSERSAPETLTITSDAGWIRYDDGTERETARAGSSRLETGNDYVVALVWKPAQCAGDLRSPARWAIIGSGAIVPANDGVVGTGEFEGTAIDEEDGDVAGPAVAEEFEDEDVEEIETALEETEIEDEVDFVRDGELCE